MRVRLAAKRPRLVCEADRAGRVFIDEPSDHAGGKLTRHDVVDAMDRRLRDGQLTVKRSRGVSGNRRKYASDLDIYVERVTGIEPALSAWESVQSPPSGPLSWESDCPRVTVVACRSPRLMAR